MVITSLVGSIPFVGNDILFLLWGGYSIDNATLHRFYSLHYLLPFLILFLSIVHILLLHEFGSSNPLGLSSRLDNIPFNPYYTLKDSFSIVLLLIFFFIIITLAPDYLGHSDNYIEANPLATPAHIVPEWYFLPLYAVLRSVTNKLLGILFIALFILSFFLLPVIQKNSFLKSSRFRPFYRLLSLIFIFLCIGLG
jgi:ubiquinol-cytochrome c reductase cytochrome b subunit